MAPDPWPRKLLAEGCGLGAIAGLARLCQSTEALKLVLEIGTPLAGCVLLIDVHQSSVPEMRLEADLPCPLCGAARKIFDERTPDGTAQEEAVDDAGFVEITAADLDAVLGLRAGSLHIPLSQLEARMHELDSGRPYVVACRVGQRSRLARRLREVGFRSLVHLRGGLLAYAAIEAKHEMF